MNKQVIAILSQINNTISFTGTPVSKGFELIAIKGDLRLSVLFYDNEIFFDLSRYPKRISPVDVFSQSFNGENRLKEAIEALKTKDELRLFLKENGTEQ